MCCHKNYSVFSLTPSFSLLQPGWLLPGSHNLLYCQTARYCLSSRFCRFCNFTSLTAVLPRKSVQLYTLIAATLPSLRSAQPTRFRLSGFSVDLKRGWCTVHTAHAAFPINQSPAQHNIKHAVCVLKKVFYQRPWVGKLPAQPGCVFTFWNGDIVTSKYYLLDGNDKIWWI